MRAAIRVSWLIVAAHGSSLADEPATLATCTRCDAVEVRHRGTPYWEAATGLSDGDWVRSSGEAAFELAGGGTIQLAASTTLFVEADGKRARISIVAGSVTGQLAGGDQGITLHTADGDVQVAGAQPVDFRIEPAQEGIATVAVTKGELIVRAASGVKKLTPTAEPKPPGPPVPPPVKPPVVPVVPVAPVAPVVPKPGKIAAPQALTKPEAHYRCLMLITIPLRWSVVAGATGYKLQIAKDMGFRALLENRDLKGTAFTFTPPGPGVYAWRVAAKDAKGYGDFGAPRRVFCDK